MTAKSVFAIGLDSADHAMIEKWSAAGHLPNLQRLRSEGSYSSLRHLEFYSDETPYTNFLTGCLPNTTSFWGPFRFSPSKYKVTAKPYEFKPYTPFYTYAGEGDRSVCAFDIPHCPSLFPEMKGIQLLGWGCHAAMGPLQSMPSDLAGEIEQTYGEHSGLALEYEGSWCEATYLKKFHAALLESIERKTQICLDLIERQHWDLFLTVFSEPHFALHKFWHLSDPTHPLFSLMSDSDYDPLLEIYQALDSSIGKIFNAVPDDADVMVFAAHGGEGNVADLHSMVFLPELLHRYSFDGRAYLCRQQSGNDQLPPVQTSIERDDWLRAVWAQMAMSPITMLSLHQWRVGSRLLPWRHGDLWWQPLTWLEGYWPKMKAFALPTFGDGYIRINLEGREKSGIVPSASFDAVCDEITQLLMDLRNPRNNEPVVKEIVRTVSDPRAQGSALPDADLVVVWRQPPADVVQSPAYGQLGPLPFRETGGHRPQGFMTIRGDGIQSGHVLQNGLVTDLAPTILSRMGLSSPAHMTGKNLLS